MKTMIGAATLAAALALMPASASADDWTGFYAGINGGYGWGNVGAIGYNGYDPNGGCGTGANQFCGPDKFPGFSQSGGFGGVQAGYNWRFTSVFVGGLEADFQGADLKGERKGAHSLPWDRIVTSEGSSTDWFGTVRGRLGVNYGALLLYGTGGVAYGNVSTHVLLDPGNSCNPSPDPGWNGCVDLKDTRIRVGYVAGGGGEWAVSPSWSVKAEYQYIDLGSVSLHGMNSMNGTARWTDNIGDSFQTVRFGLNYRFGQSYAPLK